jgi:hypothetical protein
MAAHPVASPRVFRDDARLSRRAGEKATPRGPTHRVLPVDRWWRSPRRDLQRAGRTGHLHQLVEYPLALVMTCLMRRPVTSRPLKAASRLGLALAVPAAIVALIWLVHTLATARNLPPLSVIALPALLCFAVRDRPLTFGLGVGTLVTSMVVLVAAGDHTVYRERSFFGVSQVRVDPTQSLTMLVNGTTNHGVQSPDPTRRQEPLSYFHRTGPIGQLFAAIQDPRLLPRVAVIGLGAGSLACYGRRGQEFTFFEIDPTVVRIARNPRYFTFLQQCPHDIHVILGDARLSLAGAPDRHYGLIILDAFTSDAIPRTRAGSHSRSRTTTSISGPPWQISPTTASSSRSPSLTSG